jgi:hypothetical protein
LQARLDKARRELHVVESDVSTIKSLRAALERSKGSNVDHVRATLTVEEFWVDSDRLYLIALIQALSSFAEEAPSPS